MELVLNDYQDPEHFRALCEDKMNVSGTCEYVKNEMHHIHNSCEILLTEEGAADYMICGTKYHVEPGSILVIGPMEHHFRRIERTPFLRYGLTLNPSYYQTIVTQRDLLKVFATPSLEEYNMYYRAVEQDMFRELKALLYRLKKEEGEGAYHTEMNRVLIKQLAILLFRAFHRKEDRAQLSQMGEKMEEVKHYIEANYKEHLELRGIAERFFLHPSTLSKYFPKYCGYGLHQYINLVRVCEAAKLLERTGYSMELTAHEAGFESVGTFIRQFKHIMDMTPGQYKCEKKF